MCVHSTSRVSDWNLILLVLGHVFVVFVAVLNLTVSILYLHVLFFFFIFSRSLSVWAASVRLSLLCSFISFLSYTTGPVGRRSTITTTITPVEILTQTEETRGRRVIDFF